MQVILASASPRRKQLLGLLCPEFTVQVADADESIGNMPCGEAVQQLALRKAKAIGARPDGVVIGADTLVSFGGEALGKPKDREDAARMLRMLSGNTHQVYTGVAVLVKGETHLFAECTDVTFCEISEPELQHYLDTAVYLDKAGAYGIQLDAAKFVTGIHGCFHNVMGLPVAALYQVLHRLDIL